MNDQQLLRLVRTADPLAAGVGEPPRLLLERVLASPRIPSRTRRARAWQARVVLVAVVLGATAVIASLAIAGTGWLVGSPAPATVKSDFGSYASQLGFNPVPGQATLVASNGAYQLYATLNSQGGACMLVGTPWKRPGPNGEGGDCTANSPDSTPFWAGTGGMATTSNGTTLVIYGRTTSTGAASVQFDSPDGNTVTAPVSPSGFFIADLTVPGNTCDWAPWTPWTPSFNVLDGNGHQLSATSVNILPPLRQYTLSGRGTVCVAEAQGAINPGAGQLNPGG